VEVNRSLLYAKQQLGILVQKVRLFGAEAGVEAVRTRCGEGREIVDAAPHPLAWLRGVAALAPGDPMNLVAGHLRVRRRRRLVRAGIAAACWLGLASMAVTAWSDQISRQAETRRYDALLARESVLRSDYERLMRRSAAMEQDREFIAEAAAVRMPPVPEKALGYVAGILPRGIRLNVFQTEWDPSALHWSFRMEGSIEGDEDDAHATLDSLQRQLERGPLQAHVTETPRVLATLPSPADGPSLFGFSMGGTFLEN
jgi:hypothetical protein